MNNLYKRITLCIMPEDVRKATDFVSHCPLQVRAKAMFPDRYIGVGADYVNVGHMDSFKIHNGYSAWDYVKDKELVAAGWPEDRPVRIVTALLDECEPKDGAYAD